MKFVRVCLIVTSLSTLSACNSSSAFYRLTHPPKKRGVPAATAPVVTATPPAAPTPPAVEKSAPPVVEPAAPAAPVVVAPVVPAAAVAESPAPAPVAVAMPAVVAPAAEIKITRTGQQVHLAWTLPANESGYRAIEIMRNGSDSPKGRTRIKVVRASVTQLDDTVESASERYWYWLKLTDQNTTITNLGPVEAVETAH